jgi:tyrosinase
MGGNGAKVAHQGIPIPGAPRPYNMIPPADGGGCVTTGPFKKYLPAPAHSITLSVPY